MFFKTYAESTHILAILRVPGFADENKKASIPPEMFSDSSLSGQVDMFNVYSTYIAH